MKPLLDHIFPPIEGGRVPFYRLVLRSCSQVCFQSNELTGLLFLLAVLVASPLSAAYLLVGATIGLAGRMLLGERGPVLTTGLPGLNPSLIALALPAFFQTGWTDWAMWAVLVACVAVAVVMVKVLVAVLPFPILALPFVIIFWLLYSVSPYIDAVEPAVLQSTAATALNPVKAVLLSLGQTLFSPSVWSGIIFIVGVSLSNWRHGVVALMGAVIGTLISYYYGQANLSMVDAGLYGFNGVLAAVAIYVLCDGKLRLAVLGALVATILTPALAEAGAEIEAGLQAACAPFLLATWLLVGLGRIDDRWFAPKTPASLPAAGGAEPRSDADRDHQGG